MFCHEQVWSSSSDTPFAEKGDSLFKVPDLLDDYCFPCFHHPYPNTLFYVVFLRPLQCIFITANNSESALCIVLIDYVIFVTKYSLVRRCYLLNDYASTYSHCFQFKFGRLLAELLRFSKLDRRAQFRSSALYNHPIYHCRLDIHAFKPQAGNHVGNYPPGTRTGSILLY